MEHGPIFKWMKPDPAKLPKIGGEIKAELVNNLPFEDYLARKDCMSSSGARKILKSPRRFIAETLGLLKDDEDEGEKDHYRFGRAVHMAVLEPQLFKQYYVVEPEFTGLTKDGRPSTQSKDARAKRDAWWAQLPRDAVAVTQSEHDKMLFMIDSLMSHDQAANLLRNGQSEVTGFVKDEETGIWLRVRPDYISRDKQGSLFISDVKTTRTDTPGLFSNDAARFKFHVQLAMYKDVIEKIMGETVEAVALIAMEKQGCHETSVHWLDDEDIEIGRQWYKHALRIYKMCIEKNQWPSAQTQGALLKLPTYTRTEPFPQFDFK